ncbi:Protein downstream neighbor of son [Amphibalanus amphitrite]|uniref:Protein downstream neighbor of son n=1 Tax=Amphibalanus amphitrite TaxID=1232801 RepID=A0A6A4WWX2_AMPAM|nr:Protein downstream neighbor of son [Amphibalanus amphitrite]
MSSPSKGEWLKPGDVLQKLKAKKRALKARINQGIRKQALESSQLSCFKGTSQKRTNPFRCGGDDGDAKRPRLAPAAAAPEPSMDQTLFEILRSGVGDVRTEVGGRAAPAPAAGPATGPARSASFVGLLSATATQKQQELQVDAAPKGVPDLPTDWGLKTKIRFLSKTPFPWTSRLKTLEEASAVTSCVRCLSTEQSGLDTSPNARLHRHALYWQHPWLPWLQLFPRLNRRPTGPRSLFVDPAMQDLLRTEWGESLRSLFQLLRSRQCPFFYVCASSFCCLFRSAGVGGITDTHAIITPTSRGLRDLLKRDDVQFTLPLRPGAPRPATSAPECAPESITSASESAGGSATDAVSGSPPPAASPGEGQTEPSSPAAGEDVLEASEDEDEDAEHWLERMGIQADAMPGMHSTRRKLQQESNSDGRPESTALVTGGDVYALLNFLLNSRACVAASGPLAGVPPTLLAPVGFQGASLQPLKVRHGTVQQARQTLHSFELAGPVMPHAVAGLVRLVRSSHDQFTVSLSGVRGGEALSRLPAPGPLAAPSVFGQQGLSDCGLEPDLVETLCQPPPAEGAPTAVLREVTCQEGLYTW